MVKTSLPRGLFVADCLESIEKAHELGFIYNSDYEAMKFTLSRAFDDQCRFMSYDEAGPRMARELSSIGDALQLRGYYSKSDEIGNLYGYVLSFHLVKTYARKIETLEGFVAEKAGLSIPEIYRDFLKEWVEVFEAFQGVRPLIKKGRKPSENPKSVERTLENTGSCPICGRNVKLSSSGRIVYHGYTVATGEFVGTCYGTGHKPSEVSPEGMVCYSTDCLTEAEYNRAAGVRLKAERYALSTVKAGKVGGPVYVTLRDGEPGYDKQFEYTLEKWEQNEKIYRETAANFAKLAAEWTEKPLPGIVAGFSK